VTRFWRQSVEDLKDLAEAALVRNVDLLVNRMNERAFICSDTEYAIHLSSLEVRPLVSFTLGSVSWSALT
jgi:RNA polymerase-binding transcription factor DksA